MSSRTDMVVITGGYEDEAIAKLNAWCAANDHREQQFEQLNTDAAGGSKVFTKQVWAMAGNYFPYEKLGAAFPGFGWRYPDDAIMIVNDEHGDRSEIYRAIEQ